jgi:vancomycin aglycone glucosyltransferase
MGDARVRVLLSTYDSRGGVEPLVGLAVRLRELGAEVRMCAPPDCAERLAEVGVPLVPVGPPVHSLVHAARPPTPADVPRRVAEVTAAHFGTLPAAAAGCDAVVASGLTPAMAAARSVAEKLGIRSVSVSYCPVFLPSPRHRPFPLPGLPIPPEVTDQRALNDLDIQNHNALYGPSLNASRASIGLPPVGNFRDYVYGDPLWLAADPVLAPELDPASPGVLQTGAWLVPDDRPLPAGLESFLAAGPAPVYVGFGSMRAPAGIARVAIEAIRAQGRRAVVGRGWAELALIDDRDDCFAVGEVNQQALFGRVAAVVHHGGAGTTTTAARAGAPQVVVPQWGDQPYFASRVAALGIGVAHAVAPPTTGSLAAALSTALTPQIRARALAVASTISADGALLAARLLLDPASQFKPPAPAEVMP